MTFAREHFGRQSDRFSEIAGDFRQGREKKIPKTVTAQTAVAAKAVLEKTRQQIRVFRQRDHAVAYITRRKHLQLVTETPGTAAIIRNGHDRRETLDPEQVVGLADQALQSREQRGKSGAAANRDEFLTTCVCCLLQKNAPGEVVNRLTRLNHNSFIANCRL